MYIVSNIAGSQLRSEKSQQHSLHHRPSKIKIEGNEKSFLEMAEFKGQTVVRWHLGSEPAVKRLDEILMKSYICIWWVSCWFQIADQDFTTPSCLYQWLVTFVSNEKLGSSHAVRELFKTCCTSSCTLHGLPKSYSHVQLKKLTKPQQFLSSQRIQF